MFISNNCASFHLWWTTNLFKYQKVSKYYENDCGIPFLRIFGPKKIVCSRWNLVARLIWIICRIRWWNSVFDGKHAFWASLLQKFKILSLSWNLALKMKQGCSSSLSCNLVSRLNPIFSIRCWCSFFSVFDQKQPFWGKFGIKNRNC